MHAFRPYIHKTQYYETDTMKIVHHSNYVRWMEEARCDMLEQMGIGYDTMEKQGILSPVLSVQCEYKSMTRFPDEVKITGRLVRYTGVRFDIEYEIRDVKTDTLRTVCKSSHCFIDETGKPISLRRKFHEWDKLFCEYAESYR